MAIDPQFVDGVRVGNPVHEGREVRPHRIGLEILDRPHATDIPKLLQFLGDLTARKPQKPRAALPRQFDLVEDLAISFVAGREALAFPLAIPHLLHDVIREFVEIVDAFMVKKRLRSFNEVFTLECGHVGACAQMKIEIAVVVHAVPLRFGRTGAENPTSIDDQGDVGGILP